MKANGQCLCGAVSVQATLTEEEFEACHCTMCQTWTGDPFLAVDCGTAVEFSGAENIAVYNSSDWAERG